MAFDLFKPKARPLFGLDISSSSVKMVEIVDAGKGAYRVERYAIESLPRDAIVDGNISNLEAVTESVRRRIREIGDEHFRFPVPRQQRFVADRRQDGFTHDVGRRVDRSCQVWSSA